MKSSLLFVFVFSLSILTLLADKIPKREEDATDLNNDVSSANNAALSKRAIGKHVSGRCNCFYRKMFAQDSGKQRKDLILGGEVFDQGC